MLKSRAVSTLFPHGETIILQADESEGRADGFRLDFTGIGVGKAGTTWIARCLAEHPSVCMAKGKETNFFLRRHVTSALPARRHHFGRAHYDDGIHWYKERFIHHRPGQLYGEFSNGYLGDPESAGLLHAHNPALKLLCCFRDPVDATYAGYHELSRFQPLPDTAEATIARYPQLLDYYRYHRNLQPFLGLFPRDQIHFMFFEDIKADPGRFFRRICEFLGIDPGFVPPSLHQRVNARTVLRSRAVRNLRCAIGDFMVSTPATRKLRAGLSRMGVARFAVRLFQMNERPGTVPPMSAATRRSLVDHFRDDNEALGRLLDRDLSHWNAC